MKREITRKQALIKNVFWFSITIGEITEVNPRIKVELKVSEPRILPKTISLFSNLEAWALKASSGKVVPRAKIKSPIIIN
ncbi:MAG: hypothetical protein BWY03_00398 [Parcubacteria group bacterium ADurb.Bin159]|nr:MAG: hypothetical protein BWY03_00398 [Parcubacteria group bacterium ADurb.Bin159]